jgi:hypothetical protein
VIAAIWGLAVWRRDGLTHVRAFLADGAVGEQITGGQLSKNE